MQTIEDALHVTHQLRWRGKRHENQMLLRAKRVVEVLGGARPLHEIDAPAWRHVWAVLTETLAASTALKHMHVFKAMLREAARRGSWGGDLELDLKMPRVPAEAKRVLSEDEEARMIEVIPMLRARTKQRLRSFRIWFEFSILTGLRSSETLGRSAASIGRPTPIRFSHIHSVQAKGGATVPFLMVRGKGGKKRSVPLFPRAYELLCEAEEMNQKVGAKDVNLFRWLEYTWVQRALREAQTLAFVTGDTVTAHTLRRTFATRFIDAGGSPVALQRIMGHDSISTTMRYVKQSDQMVANEIVRLGS